MHTGTNDDVVNENQSYRSNTLTPDTNLKMSFDANVAKTPLAHTAQSIIWSHLSPSIFTLPSNTSPNITTNSNEPWRSLIDCTNYGEKNFNKDVMVPSAQHVDGPIPQPESILDEVSSDQLAKELSSQLIDDLVHQCLDQQSTFCETEPSLSTAAPVYFCTSSTQTDQNSVNFELMSLVFSFLCPASRNKKKDFVRKLSNERLDKLCFILNKLKAHMKFIRFP